jgi:biopolymer transport protein ExbB/TolQ
MSMMVSASHVANALFGAAGEGSGAPVMFINLAVLGVALAIAMERIVVLAFRHNLDAPAFMEQIAKLVITRNVDRALKLCAAAPHAPLARVIAAGLGRAQRSEREIARSMRHAIAEQTPAITARVAWLPSLASLAALLGLIGSALAARETLRRVDEVPPEQRLVELTSAMATAMHSTIWGLCIAALCVVLHLFLAAYARRMLHQVEQSALRLEDLLSRQRSAETAPLDLEKSA